jgi:hypothetical protein
MHLKNRHPFTFGIGGQRALLSSSSASILNPFEPLLPHVYF